MDQRNEQVLELFRSHSRIKNFLTVLSYFVIVAGIFIYLFYAMHRNQAVKLVAQYKDNPDGFKTEKIMTNPRINFQYNGNEIYHIQAKKAFHKDNQEIALYDVSANGDIGKITAGELKIDESGNRLIFTQNPVLILNKTKK